MNKKALEEIRVWARLQIINLRKAGADAEAANDFYRVLSLLDSLQA